MTERLLCVNVDVDGLRHYRQIHGLPAVAGEHQVWTLGVPRFLDLFAEFGLKATFFAVAEDLAEPAPAAAARQVLQAGHELANHSFSHPYDLVRLPQHVRARELLQADAALREFCQGPVHGYRAPGYNQSQPVIDLLVELGYRYDSSAFPCPPYVLAKAAVIALMALRGRKSRAILARPWAAFGSTRPRRLATRAGALWSLPISVLPGIRFPLIGTAMTALGPTGIRLLAPLMEHMPWLNLEFHALDLLDLNADRLDPALARQPDLHVPLQRKRALFRSVLQAAARGRPTMTLAQAAIALSAAAEQRGP